MKINNSEVSMRSFNNKVSYSHLRHASIEARASKNIAGELLLSGNSDDLVNSINSLKYGTKKSNKTNSESDADKVEANARDTFKEQMKANKSNASNKLASSAGDVSEQYKITLQMIKIMFAMLAKGGKGMTQQDYNKISKEVQSETNSLSYQSNSNVNNLFSLLGDSNDGATYDTSAIGGITSDAGTVWERVTATTGFSVEAEYTKFSTNGIARTEDGRTIEFGVEMSLSRAVMEHTNTLTAERFIYTDPLIVNVGSGVASISDQKFKFDLDSDGLEDDISFATNGSGFLALDKDGNGKIDNGNELFGTKSGDGFADLAEYDEDGNGWIDENDGVFEKLKVWTKDELGNDKLFSLKEADVGAIYLGNATTDFTLKGEEGATNGALRKTGIFLRESTGHVGTIQHVDLTM